MSSAMNFESTPDAGTSGGFGDDSSAGSDTDTNKFTATDCSNLLTMLTDCQCSVYGDQGRAAGFTLEQKVTFTRCVAVIKPMIHQLRYAGGGYGSH